MASLFRHLRKAKDVLPRDIKRLYRLVRLSDERRYVEKGSGRIARLLRLPDDREELEALLQIGIDEVQAGSSMYFFNSLVWVGYLDQNATGKVNEFLYVEELES